eukprot:jgi/Mesvir1/18256/Mv09529-RA.2
MPATPRPMMKVLLPWDPGNRPRIQHTPDVDYLLVGWAMPQNEVYRHELPTAVFVGSVVPVTDVAGLASLKESLSGWDPGLRAHAHESSQEHPRHTLGESLPATSRRTVPPVSRSGDHAGIRPTCSRAQQEEGSGKEIGMSAWPHHGPPRIMGSWTIHPASANKGTAASTIPQARVITDRWLSDADQQAMGAAAREHGDRDVNIRALARAGALGPGGPGVWLELIDHLHAAPAGPATTITPAAPALGHVISRHADLAGTPAGQPTAAPPIPRHLSCQLIHVNGPRGPLDTWLSHYLTTTRDCRHPYSPAIGSACGCPSSPPSTDGYCLAPPCSAATHRGSCPLGNHSRACKEVNKRPLALDPQGMPSSGGAASSPEGSFLDRQWWFRPPVTDPMTGGGHKRQLAGSIARLGGADAPGTGGTRHQRGDSSSTTSGTRLAPSADATVTEPGTKGRDDLDSHRDVAAGLPLVQPCRLHPMLGAKIAAIPLACLSHYLAMAERLDRYLHSQQWGVRTQRHGIRQFCGLGGQAMPAMEGVEVRGKEGEIFVDAVPQHLASQGGPVNSTNRGGPVNSTNHGGPVYGTNSGSSNPGGGDGSGGASGGGSSGGGGGGGGGRMPAPTGATFPTVFVRHRPGTQGDNLSALPPAHPSARSLVTPPAALSRARPATNTAVDGPSQPLRPGMKLKGGSGPRVRRQQQVQQGWLAGEDAAHAGGAGGDCTPTANPCPFPSLAGVEVTSMNVVGTSGERWQRRLGGHACCISQHPSHPLDPPSRSDPESSIARSCSRCLVFGGIATALGILAGLVLLLWRRLLLLVLWIPLQLRHVCKSRQRSARVNNGRTNLQHASSSTDACIGGRASMATDDVPALYRTSQLAAQPHAGVVRTSERSRQGRAYRQEPRRPTAAPHSIAADSLLETRHFLTRGRGLLTGPRDPPLGSSRNGVAHGGDLPHPSWASSMAHIDGSTSTGHDSASGRKQGKRAAELFPRAAARLVLPSSPQPGAAAAAAKVAAAAVAATSIHEHRVATCHPPTSAAPPIPLAAAPRHRCCPADPRLGPAGGGRCLLPADILTSPLSLVMVARRLYEAWLWPWLLVRSVGAVDREVVVDRMVSLLVDVTLGVLAAATLLRHEPHGCHLVASLLACQASLATSALTWLTGAPAGIKLNPELVHFLAATTGAIMRVWVAALSALPPASITWLVRLVAAAGLCGLSSILFVSGDLVGLLFLPMTVAHGALSLLLRAHLRMLTQLWRGLRGRKHNPLRLRLDTFECGADQMVLGALLFTPMLLLLPTATAFALTSAVFRALPLMATAALQYAGCLLATVPWFSAVVAWLAPRTSRHRCGGGATALADASAHGNELRVWAGVGSGWPAQFPMEQRGNLTCAVSPLDMKKRAWTQEVVVCGHIGLVGRG